MNIRIQNRALDIAEYILKHKCTIREAAEVFQISKSTVHLDMLKRLKDIDPDIWYKVRCITLYNKSVRHIRGGQSTAKKFRSLEQVKVSKVILHNTGD